MTEVLVKVSAHFVTLQFPHFLFRKQPCLAILVSSKKIYLGWVALHYHAMTLQKEVNIT